jgi:NAD(P)H-flavin reductase
MLKPCRASCFLARPISVAGWGEGYVEFLIERRGRGTAELADLRPGEKALLTGPLGTSWTDCLPDPIRNGTERIALVSGGLGIAPLRALLLEAPELQADFFAGFRTPFTTEEEHRRTLGLVDGYRAGRLVLAAENAPPIGGVLPTKGAAGEWRQGLVTDFFEARNYGAVCACGPEAMLKTAAAKCAAAGVLCFVSMERRMACGVGACLGCVVGAKTDGGGIYKRCCTDGPVFMAKEVIFD